MLSRSHSFLFPTSPPRLLCQNYLSSHVLDVTRRMIWFLGFSLYQWAGNSSQTKTRHHQRLPCGPPVSQMLVPGLDWATKKAGELWWAQQPVHFIFILFPFPFEFWVILWNGGDHWKDLEVAVLGHRLSGVCITQNISFYTCFQFKLLPWL